MEQLLRGELVRLKSGGPCMIVTALGAYSGWTPRRADTVSCLWFEGEKAQETVFDVALLEKVTSRGYPQRDRLSQHLALLHEKEKSAIPSHPQ